jgi:hypothetical protein
MSTVRLHLPFYDEIILSKIMKLMNEIKNIYIININELKNYKNYELYENICKKIFENYAMKIIILGNFNSSPLPISNNSKILIKELINKPIQKYDKYNYKIMDKKKLLDKLDEFIHTYDTHIFSIDDFNGDVFKLWFLTQNIEYENIDLSELIKKLFKKTDIRKIKFWNKILIDDIKEFPNEYERMKNSDLSFPIIVFKNKNDYTILDGFHRLIKAYRYDYKKIKVKYVNFNLIKKVYIDEKNLEKDLGLIVKI